MDYFSTNILYLNHRMYLCIILFVASAILTVSGERTLSDQYENEANPTHDLKTVWDIYLLPKLEHDFNRKISNWLDEQMNVDKSASYEYPTDHSGADEADAGSSRFKRLGVAGLENLDLMTKTLEQNRLPMMVNSMNTNRMRMLMQTVGKRRK